MPSPNGLAYRPVMRFSVVPQWVPFEIERPNPDDPNGDPVVVTLRAWDKSLTHSATIDIAVEAAIDVYREVIYAEQQRADETPGATQIMPLEQAATAMHAEILCAVIEGLEMDEATVLAAGPWQEILSTLGWWQPAAEAPAAPSDDKQDADDPEGPGEPDTTTAGSSPDSVPSMALFDGES
jgi:hypothetical protein